MPSASISSWHLVPDLTFTASALFRHRTCIIRRPIINLRKHQHPAGTTAHQPATSCPVCPSLTWPQHQSFNLISTIHEGPLAGLHATARPCKGVWMYKVVWCQYPVMLKITMTGTRRDLPWYNPNIIKTLNPQITGHAISMWGKWMGFCSSEVITHLHRKHGLAFCHKESGLSEWRKSDFAVA